MNISLVISDLYLVSGTSPLIRAAHYDFNADELVFNHTCNLNAELFMG